MTNIIKNIIEEFTKSYIIYDQKIYIYKANSLIDISKNDNIYNFKEEEKNKNKNYIKSINHLIQK